jgi:hypothetical protein
MRKYLVRKATTDGPVVVRVSLQAADQPPATDERRRGGGDPVSLVLPYEEDLPSVWEAVLRVLAGGPDEEVPLGED